MEYMGIQLRIGMYVTFWYEGKRMRGRIETLAIWGIRIQYAIPENAEGRRVANRSCNFYDKVLLKQGIKVPKITGLVVS